MSGFDIDELMNDAEAMREAPDTGKLSAIALAAEEIIAIERDIEALEDRVAEKQKEIKRIREERIPALMAEAKITSLGLQNGGTLTLKSDTFVSITKEKQPFAFEWLRDNGFDDIIKNNIEVSFGRGEAEHAEQLKAFLDSDQNFQYKQKEAVHPQTLKAFVKEQRAKGIQFPEDKFTMYDVTYADIKFKQ